MKLLFLSVVLLDPAKSAEPPIRSLISLRPAIQEDVRQVTGRIGLLGIIQEAFYIGQVRSSAIQIIFQESGLLSIFLNISLGHLHPSLSLLAAFDLEVFSYRLKPHR
jgi:hypothetical protein